MKILKSSFFVVILFFVNIAFAENSPVLMLEKSANQILETLKTNKADLKNNPAIIQKAVREHLLPNVDVVGMSRSVLGRITWSKASASEKEEFSKSFTNLVIRTYATPLSEYTDETIKFLPSKDISNKRFTRVNSVIIRKNGQNIPLSYSLVLKNNAWKVYDFSVEGVSLLQSFHNQFGQALQKSSIKELISDMNSKKMAKS